ncbi:DUF4919 domain-containing protein [Hymenobacter properus]|uniref:DUF4919 domain-containing protein n=1 Tax=Hymenobacter properus TaxID=2791026 RepID=A0A931BEG7_9BACT|nr:DUF4919 domain-containing protein [Hymenobacter properus]MBF9140993.1 DUF4919 domain-containing protein [Hymenobacter properus]MBR7719802.1 DUF4919 domain-containing protein [Microvirga sp. SRT04]
MRFLLLSVCLLFTFRAMGQKVSNVDFDEIKRETTNPGSPYYFPKQLTRLQASDSTLQAKDYHYLYYGQIFQPSYNPEAAAEASEAFTKAFAAKQYREALALGAKDLRAHPFNLRLTTEMIVCASQASGRRLAQRYANRYFGLLRALRSSGDGHSPATAFVVPTVDDEYTLMGYYNLDFSEQSRTGTTDVFTLKPMAEASAGDAQQHFNGNRIYFNVSQPLNYLGGLIKDK